MRIFIFSLLMFTNALWAEKENIQSQKKLVVDLATTEWCPYVCEGAEAGKGIVFDYLSDILSKQNIELNLVFLPWSRAIKEVSSGRFKGLLTATEAEAPHLTFTTVPSMFYKMCFFTSNNHNWLFTDVRSLANVNLAIVKDYGFGEPLDSYIAIDKNESNLYELSGYDSVQRLIQLLDKDRVEAFIEDKYVVDWQLDGESNLRNAGCLTAIPFYMAFEPEFAESTGIVQLIDQALSEPKNQRLFHQVYLSRYFSSKSLNN
jgi:polar amino acid transport system substrate-binding protein